MRKFHALSAFFLLLIAGCSKDDNGNTMTAPAAPANLTATVISSSQVNLSWTDNSSDETGFKIQRKTTGANFADVAGTGKDSTAYSDLNLSPNTTYTYRVYSYNSAGNSLQYSNEVTVTTTASVNLCEVTVGTQIWSCKNLDVSHYRNGDPIPQVTDPAQWINLTSGAWCWYNNDSATYAAVYGRLYNWYAVNDPRGLAPQGWHVATDAEWTTLTTFLGGESVAGGKLKTTGTQYWESPNTGATNSTGYSALPGGYRGGDFSSGSFAFSIRRNGAWWTSSSSDPANEWIWIRTMRWDQNSVYRTVSDKRAGQSVRLVKD
jgi:uncharacterized protein (TIGR02145 family)